MSSSNPIKIDLQQIVNQRLGKRSRYVPRFIVSWLERLIHQDELNEMLEANRGLVGADFCEGVLNHLGVTVNITNPNDMPDPTSRHSLIVCNHPLGGLDGMALIALLTKHFGCNVEFVVNDLLMAIEPLQCVFLPINKHGGQSRQSLEAIDRAFAGDKPIIIFPAGLVSRMSGNGQIKDLEWQKMFVNKSIKSQRDIVPLYFGGHNSMTFYRTARWRKRLGLKFNFEMTLLPREVFGSRGKTFDLTFGQKIAWQQLKGGSDALRQAQEIKERVYKLATKNSLT
jgi:putative hemolysin